MRILLLDLDTLRPDHLGCYGYHRNTSPNIDNIAAQGVRFTNYYCSDAPCLPSRSALMSGRFGMKNGVVGHGGTAADMRLEGRERGFTSQLAEDCLPMLLRRAGLHTVSISPFAERHSSWTFNAGFNEIHNTGKEGLESAEDITPVALRWIRGHAKEDNWLLHINYWDSHTPYRTPADYPDPFTDEDIPAWLNEETLARHKQKVGPHSVNETNMFGTETYPEFPKQPCEIKDMADMVRMLNGYDNGIHYMDAHIGKLMAALEEEGVADDLAVIVTSDHGEAFGELGVYAEHSIADQAVCRIPMIVKWPGCRAGAADHGLHYQLDLAPTLAELLDQPKQKNWDGQSYAPALRTGDDCGRDYLVLSQCSHVCQRSVRFGDYLYIRSYHDGYHLFPREMLFDLKQDIHEQRDIAPLHPELCDKAAHLLCDWHDDCMMDMPDAVDPLWTVIREGGPFHARGELAAYLKRLEETGRGWAVPELLERHPDEV